MNANGLPAKPLPFQLLVLNESLGYSGTPCPGHLSVLPPVAWFFLAAFSLHPELLGAHPPGSRELTRAPQRPCGCGPGSPPCRGSMRGCL